MSNSMAAAILLQLFLLILNVTIGIIYNGIGMWLITTFGACVAVSTLFWLIGLECAWHDWP